MRKVSRRKLHIKHYYISRLTLLLFIIRTSLAITGPQLQNTFNLHYPTNTEPGGCDQNAPNGKPMLPHVIASASDAFSMAKKIQQTIDSYHLDTPYADRMRRLLFSFFGISFGDDNLLDEHKEQDCNYVKQMFIRVTDIRNKPLPKPIDRPWLHCLESYARYTVWDVENPSIPAAEFCQAKLPDGSWYPGMMYADFLTIHSPQPVRYYYHRSGNNPYQGRCSASWAFTNWGPRPENTGMWGITLCPSHFDFPNFNDFPNIPAPSPDTPPIETIKQLSNTAGVTLLHELFHLPGPDIIDQPAIEPPGFRWPTEVNLDTIDWSVWTLNPQHLAYGFTHALFLGLARPDLALRNAENYAMFALCMTLIFLECTTATTVTNVKRENAVQSAGSEVFNSSLESGSMSPLRFFREDFAQDHS